MESGKLTLIALDLLKRPTTSRPTTSASTVKSPCGNFGIRLKIIRTRRPSLTSLSTKLSELELWQSTELETAPGLLCQMTPELELRTSLERWACLPSKSPLQSINSSSTGRHLRLEKPHLDILPSSTTAWRKPKYLKIKTVLGNMYSEEASLEFQEEYHQPLPGLRIMLSPTKATDTRPELETYTESVLNLRFLLSQLDKHLMPLSTSNLLTPRLEAHMTTRESTSLGRNPLEMDSLSSSTMYRS